VLTYKTLNTSVPQYLSQRINRRVKARTLRSSATPLLIQPFARTDFAKRSFRWAAPSVWNSLPASVIGSDSLSVFKSSLKHSYFVGTLASTHNQLPPAPLKLRPYDAIQIYLLLLLLSQLLGNRRWYGNHFVPHSLGGVLMLAFKYGVDVTTRNGVMAHVTWMHYMPVWPRSFTYLNQNWVMLSGPYAEDKCLFWIF